MKDHSITLFYIVIFAFCAVILIGTVLVFVSVIHEKTESYEMPNGEICKYKHITTSGFGAATMNFEECSDGKIYINPESYKVIK